MTVIQALFWTLAYFSILATSTALDVGLFRKRFAKVSPYINLITLTMFSVLFYIFLTKKTEIKPQVFANVSLKGLLVSLVGALLLYLVLDRGIDPFLEKNFPASEEGYQRALDALRKSPVTSLIHIGLLAPIVEELLMRGYLFPGLSAVYGVFVALLLSSALFALLHFNMVQTISAFLAGLVLGLLYLQTGSVLCCILTHSLYNFASYTQSYKDSPMTE